MNTSHDRNFPTPERRDHRFVIGLLAGTVAGAALAMWCVPGAVSELRDRLTGSARRLGQRASDEYRQAKGRVGDAVDDLTRLGQDVRDDVAETVARGAREVDRFATAAKSNRTGG